jgi:hypothetical protein
LSAQGLNLKWKEEIATMMMMMMTMIWRNKRQRRRGKKIYMEKPEKGKSVEGRKDEVK